MNDIMQVTSNTIRFGEEVNGDVFGLASDIAMDLDRAIWRARLADYFTNWIEGSGDWMDPMVREVYRATLTFTATRLHTGYDIDGRVWLGVNSRDFRNSLLKHRSAKTINKAEFDMILSNVMDALSIWRDKIVSETNYTRAYAPHFDNTEFYMWDVKAPFPYDFPGDVLDEDKAMRHTRGL